MLPINKVITITVSGFAARIISAQKIKQPIIAVTNNQEVSKGFNLFSNTKGIFFQTRYSKDNLDHIPKCIHFLWKKKEISSNDFIIIVAFSLSFFKRQKNEYYTDTLCKRFN